MNLLESYIRGYLLKEQINSADHQLIEETMEELDRNLRSMTPSMSLDTLSFNPGIIAGLRDYRSLRDEGDKKTKPKSLKNKFPSQSLGGFNMTISPGYSLPGLGFNPIEKLKSDKTYYTKKIQELIDVYKREDPVKWLHIIETLHNCLNLKKSINQAGMKVLGAGLYRIVVTIPGLDEIVVKIGLGDKGRGDCRKEIDFSDGKGASRLEHQKNFPVIYTRSDNKNWYAIEKAIFFGDKMLSADSNSSSQDGKNELKSDIEEQFLNTMTFLEEILDEFKLKEISGFRANTKWKMFKNYLHTIFKKDKSYEEEHEKQTPGSSSYKNKKSPLIAKLTDKTKINLDKRQTAGKSDKQESIIIKSKTRNIFENSSVDSEITKNIFKKKLEIFLDEIGFSLAWNPSFLKKNINIKDVKDKITSNHLNEKSIKLMLNEVGSMFDQAVVTNIRDLHTGNMGFKKNDQDKWQLIFTDIDSK
jgi:hypothetical protein